MAENQQEPQTAGNTQEPQIPTTPPPSPYQDATVPYFNPQAYQATPSVGYPPAYPGYPPVYPQGYQQVPPQGYPGYPPVYPQGYQPVNPGYPGHPVYVTNLPPQKRLIWPWVLIGCLILAVLGIGGCVGCVSYLVNETETNAIVDRYNTVPLDNYDYSNPYDNSNPYDYSNPYNNSIPNSTDNGSGITDYFSYGDGSTYTVDQLKSAVPGLLNISDNGNYTTGVYEVGANKDMVPGLYYLEGSQTVEGQFYLFNQQSDGRYVLRVPVVYFGNYYADLQEGEAIVFVGPESAQMHKATDPASMQKAPFLSGCYRVGVDIPAGTYKVTGLADNGTTPSGESGAYIMKDMQWNDDSLLESYYVVVGGSHTITVEDGQYLELYFATMTPVAN